MHLVGAVIDTLLLICMLVLLARFVLDWVQMFARQWRPNGAVAVLCEALYSLTDPPLRAVRGVIPAIRLGGAAIDLSPLILFIAIYLARTLNQAIFLNN